LLVVVAVAEAVEFVVWLKGAAAAVVSSLFLFFVVVFLS
jgi:hypothetical protein